MGTANRKRNIVVVGGGTSGSVLAARLTEDRDVSVTLFEAGPDHDAYDAAVLEPIRAAESWTGEGKNVVPTRMATQADGTAMIQGRLLGGTSAVNGLATLRGQPSDYDGPIRPPLLMKTKIRNRGVGPQESVGFHFQ